MLGHGAILPLTYWGTFSQQPHQQCRNVPFSPYSHQLSHLHQYFAFLAIFRILQASHPRECHFMCISLMTSAAVHLFLSLLAICLSSLCWRCVGCKCSASFICRLSISWHGLVLCFPIEGSWLSYKENHLAKDVWGLLSVFLWDKVISFPVEGGFCFTNAKQKANINSERFSAVLFSFSFLKHLEAVCSFPSYHSLLRLNPFFCSSQTDVQKILRNARKLPEKTQTFYKVRLSVL